MAELTAQHLPVLLVLAIFGERMREVFTKREVVPGKKQESLTFTLFMVCGVAMIAGGITEYYSLGRSLYWPTLLAGAIAAIVSFRLRRAAIRALGRFWSLHIEMREKHEFVKTGPFASARHPVYFSMILELLATGLVLNAWITLAGVYLIFIPTLLLRVRLEEKALLAHFGPEYQAYMETTPAIFPSFGRKERS